MIAAAIPRDFSRAKRLVQVAFDYLTMVSLPALTFSLVASGPLLKFLLGASFSSAGSALAVMMGAYVVVCWGFVVGNMVILLDLSGRFIRYAVVALILNLGLNFALVPRYGYMAAAWVTLITELLVQGLTVRAVLQAMDFRPQLSRVARTVGACLVLGPVLWAVKHAGGGLAPEVAVTLIGYPALLFAGGILNLRELAELLRDRKAG